MTLINYWTYLMGWAYRDLDFPNIQKRAVSSVWKLVQEDIYYEDGYIYVYVTQTESTPLTREEFALR